jgi:hypothetical protein
MSKFGWVIFALIAASAALGLLQLWLSLFSGAVFLKISITLGVIITLLGVFYLVQKEFRDEKKMRDDGYVD